VAEAEDDGGRSEEADAEEHGFAGAALDGGGQEGERDGEGAERGHGAEQAESVGAGVQDIDGEDGHERGSAAEENGEEVKRDGAEEQAGSDDVAEAGEHDVDGEAFLFDGGPRLDDREEAEEEDQADESEDVDERGSVEVGEAAAEDVGEGDGEEQASYHGPGGVGDLEDGSAQGDGVDEVLFGDEGGDEGAGGWTAEAAAGADDEEDCVDEPDVVSAVEGEPEKSCGGDGLDGVAGENDGAAVVVVGDVARGQDEEDAGGEESEAGVAEGEGGVGDLVNLPGDAYGLRLRSHDAGESRCGVVAEFARLPCDGGTALRLGCVAHCSFHADTGRLLAAMCGYDISQWR
jgi:hypothetical protein